MIAIINSGVANLASVLAALERLGVDACVTQDAQEIRQASRVILPGVGAAPAAMRELEQRSLTEVLRNLRQPVLGICLGMQLMFEFSEEGASAKTPTPCLGLIKGTVRKLRPSSAAPLPHMGWNALIKLSTGNPLLEGITEGSFCYFVHSFAADLSDTTIAQANYDQSFTAACQRDNFFGCQFHPERSGDVGQQILRNFLKI